MALVVQWNSTLQPPCQWYHLITNATFFWPNHKPNQSLMSYNYWLIDLIIKSIIPFNMAKCFGLLVTRLRWFHCTSIVGVWDFCKHKTFSVLQQKSRIAKLFWKHLRWRHLWNVAKMWQDAYLFKGPLPESRYWRRWKVFSVFSFPRYFHC